MLRDRYRHRPHLEYDMPLPSETPPDEDRESLEDAFDSGRYEPNESAMEPWHSGREEAAW